MNAVYGKTVSDVHVVRIALSVNININANLKVNRIVVYMK